MHKSANKENGAHLGIVAETFWRRDRQCAHFVVQVFAPFVQSHFSTPLAQCFPKQMKKKWAYEERREVEHGFFSPLVFTTAGGMGATATMVYKRLASHIEEKHGPNPNPNPYGKTLHWLRCQLSYSLLRSGIMCLQGSCSACHHPDYPLSGDTINLACAEGRVPTDICTQETYR